MDIVRVTLWRWPMTLETFLLWVAVGAIAGFLASLVVGTGFGSLGDIIIGVVGAFLGGWIFRALGWHAPFAGMAGTVSSEGPGQELEHRANPRRPAEVLVGQAASA